MLKIGSLELEFPVTQAALAGYGDAPMRLISRRHGASYALRDVILDQIVVQRGKRQRELLRPPLPADRPLGAQLMGAEPGQFAMAAGMLAAVGYDVIDLNFACPVKKVLGRCRGGFLLSDPPRATAILRAVRETVPAHVPVTLKLRRGLDDSPGSERNFFRILDAALGLGLAAVTVHPRTVKQRYAGPSCWPFLARLKQHAGGMTIIGSGDLFSALDIQRMLTETGVDGVAVARGCIGNPWIFRDARAVLSDQPLPDPPGVAEQGQVILEHLMLSGATHGERRAGRLMRKFGIKYAELHPHAAQVRWAFIKATTYREALAVLDEWYDPGKTWPPAVRPPGDGLLRPAPGNVDLAGR